MSICQIVQEVRKIIYLFIGCGTLNVSYCRLGLPFPNNTFLFTFSLPHIQLKTHSPKWVDQNMFLLLFYDQIFLGLEIRKSISKHLIFNLKSFTFIGKHLSHRSVGYKINLVLNGIIVSYCPQSNSISCSVHSLIALIFRFWESMFH